MRVTCFGLLYLQRRMLISVFHQKELQPSCQISQRQISLETQRILVAAEIAPWSDAVILSRGVPKCPIAQGQPNCETGSDRSVLLPAYKHR